MGICITAMGMALGSRVVRNEDLVGDGRVPFSAEDILRKTGIAARRVCSEEESLITLAESACRGLEGVGMLDRKSVDALVFVTDTPEYMIPSTACVLQGKLKLETSVAAFDIGLSCTGFVYGLSVIDSLLQARKARKALLVVGSCYSKYLEPKDASLVTLFGDGVAAVLLEWREDGDLGIVAERFCTVGEGCEQLIRRGGGAKCPNLKGMAQEDPFIRMNGPEIFRFVQRTIPEHVMEVLREAGREVASVDYFLFHQGSGYMVETLRRRLNLEEDRCPIRIRNTGNLVGASIPMLLWELSREGMLGGRKLVLMCGFGAGLSYGSVMLRLGPEGITCG